MDIKINDTTDGLLGNDDMRELIDSSATSIKLQREHDTLKLERMNANVLWLKETIKETIK